MNITQILVLAHTVVGLLGMAVWYRIGKLQGKKLERQSTPA
jgi:membrane protein DedA with SNARE-associated domain